MTDGAVLVLVETLEVRDPELADRYRAGAREQLLRLGGTLLARGATAFEGDAPTGPVMIQRWPSEAAFRAWQASDGYRPLLAMRNEAMTLRILILSAVE